MSSIEPSRTGRTSTDATADAARVVAGMRARLDARVARGWNPRAAGQWSAAFAVGFLAAGALCLVANSERRLPYGYYQVLRWTVFLVCGAASIGCLRVDFGRARTLWDLVGATVCAGCAVLFNPLAPIHLRRATWSVVDLVVGIAFLLFGLLCCPQAFVYLRYARTRARATALTESGPPSP